MTDRAFELVLENGARVGVQTNRRGGLKVYNLSPGMFAYIEARPSGQEIAIPEGHCAAISNDGNVYLKKVEDHGANEADHPPAADR